MMEVKQNTAVDLNDLLTSSKNSGTDDAVMTDLTDPTAHGLVNCDLIKSNDLSNGDVNMSSLIDEVDAAANINATVNSELEDALLAEDDVLPKIISNKIAEPVTAATHEDILADKVETSNSTTSSNNVRDPGDDLDTLLSKINDIVEDCIDNESESAEHQQTVNKIAETKANNILNDSVIFVEETKVAGESGNLIEKQMTVNNVDTALSESELTKNLTTTEECPLPPSASEETPIKDVLTTSTIEESKENLKDNTASETQLEEDKEITTENNSLENNENLKKTEEQSKGSELVQDNEITSNCNENTEAEQTLASSSSVANEVIEKVTSQKEAESTEAEDNPKRNNEENVLTNNEQIATQNEETTTTNTAASDNVDNEDSDDEIVFYVDKPPEITKSNETSSKSKDSETDTTTIIKGSSMSKKECESTKEEKKIEDDDVVLLLDDDDEVKKSKESKETSTDSTDKKEKTQTSCEDQKESKDINLDNSDNARDDFVNENEKSSNKPTVAETPEETNSNCSSSSNLLQEAEPVKNASDEPTPEEGENEEEEDDGDVELIETEPKESEIAEKVEDTELAPPAKRIRLSVDKVEGTTSEIKDVEASKLSEKKQESKDIEEDEKKSDSISSLKRSHDVIELEADEKSNDSKTSSEAINKKAKTDDKKIDTSDNVVEIKDDKPAEDTKPEIDDKKDIKAVPSYQPIPLYPAPKFEVLKSEPAISLDFLKKFRKSFDNMTKQDLEELVLQKVVEAIIHRSEFSEMRELIEKQEKLITAHRSKISELSKQFRDLEMVHNRVVKDIEQRNSQFIMPVKITRAVGLQVYIPNKKTLTDTASSSTGPSVPSSPQRPVSTQASTPSSSTSLTPPQRQFIASQPETQQQRITNTGPAGPASAGNTRRGCVQKITPIRPVPGANQSAPAGPTSTAATSAYRNTPNHSSAAQPRILNKNAAPTPNPTSIQRSRFMGSNQDSQQRMPPQQQISRTSNMPVSGQRGAPNATPQPKPQSNVAAAMQRRSEPLAPATANTSTSSIVDNYINTLTHLTGGNTAVSITPAKPKEKAVIDLTDEDEAPRQTASSQPATQVPLTQAQRRSLPAQNSANSQYGRPAPPLARIPPNANQMANNKNRQMSSMQAQKNNSFTSISTPPGTSITRINVSQNSTNIQRVKYSHPAPLPATPPQAFNPSWKLPPPRPTIRISNLDNGIVISWTMEESMDRHAECVSYQIYAYQETSGPPMVDSWRHVGDVKAMLLPMAVTLTQFQEGQRYYFAVRAVDCHQRFGPFSLPKTWS